MKKQYEFKLTEPEAEIVMKALGELPAKKSLEVINKLRNQFSQPEPEPKQEKE